MLHAGLLADRFGSKVMVVVSLAGAGLAIIATGAFALASWPLWVLVALGCHRFRRSGMPGRFVIRVDRKTTSWSPSRSHRRHRRLWIRVRSSGRGPAAGFRCHRHRSCCPFTSSSEGANTRRRRRPREAQRGRNLP
jgi:hypothetical protein